MDITEVRIKLMEEPGERLQAFCSITFDNCFVIRDLKIIEGTNGPFVAMPSRKLTSHCPHCGLKNHLRAAFCNQCGSKLRDERAVKDEDGRAKLYADIAHPINSSCREMIQEHVIRAFQNELERSRLPNYVSSYDDFDEEYTPHTHHRAAEPKPAQPRAVIPGSEQTRVQPAEQEPRGPHKSPTQQGTRQSGSRPDEAFGAGIF